MPTSLEQRVQDLLGRLPEGGLEVAGTLICDTLHYPPVGERLSPAQWPESVRHLVASDPVLVARYQADDWPFDVVYAQIPVVGSSRAMRLSPAAEHRVAGALIQAHPHILLLFSDPDERCWELVCARVNADGRPALRRLVVSPWSRLGATATRVAMLDLASMPGYLQGELSAGRIAQRHAEAFDAGALGRDFLHDFATLHGQVRDDIAASALVTTPAAHAQALLDRLLILYFLQKAGWLGGSHSYLHDSYCAHRAAALHSRTFHEDIAHPLCEALSAWLAAAPGADLAPPRADLGVRDDTYAALFDRLFEHYDLTLDEESVGDQTVAVGPEILGKVFESLVLVRERDGEVDRRRATGSYYTPHHIVAFMCCQALAEYLAADAGVDRDRAARLLALPPVACMEKHDSQWLSAAFSSAQAQHVRRALLNVRVCDPAAGSGAFLIGLLQTIANTVEALDDRIEGETSPAATRQTHGRKRAVVEHCLHGVEIQPAALRACALRLWLALLADYQAMQPIGVEATVPPAEATTSTTTKVDAGTALTIPLPLLPDLSPALREGNGLLERLGNGLSAPFRWRVDFAGVFEEKGGFDVMIGNPPYGARVSKGDWAEIKSRYSGASRAGNSAAAFLALPFECVHERGVACQIVPKSVTFSAGWGATRRLIWDTGSLVGSADVSRAFEGVLLEQEVLLYRVSPGHETHPHGWALRGETFVETHRAPLPILKQHDTIMNHVPPLGGHLLQRLAARCQPLGLHTVTRRGARWQAHIVGDGAEASHVEPVLRGRDVRQFALAPALPRIAVHPTMTGKLGAMSRRKIVSQNIIAHITQPYDTLVVISALDRIGLAALDTVNMTFPRRGCPFPIEFVVALLNSSFARWYFYFAIYNRAVRTMHFDAPYVGKLPVPDAPQRDVDQICALADSLATAQDREETKYFLHGQHEAYNALDAAIFRLYALTDQEIRLVLRDDG